MLNNTIDTRQLFILLVLSRIFHLLTYVPRSGTSVNGSAMLLSFIVSTGFILIAFLPMWVMISRRGDSQIIDYAQEISPALARITAFIFGIFCLFVAVETVSNFIYFLTSTVYVSWPVFWLAILFTVVCAYGAAMGLEAMARVGFYLFIVTIAAGIFIAVALIPRYNSLWLISPLEEGVSPVMKGAVGSFSTTFELIPFYLLASKTKGSKPKTFLLWAVVMLLIYELIGIMLLTSLGDYSKTQIFPFYAAASVAEISIFQRLDALHIAVWIFIGALKVALFLYLASFCFHRVSGRPKSKLALPLCGAAVIIVSSVLLTKVTLFHNLSAMLRTGIPMVTVGFILPLILMVIGVFKKGEKRHEKNR